MQRRERLEEGIELRLDSRQAALVGQQRRQLEAEAEVRRRLAGPGGHRLRPGGTAVEGGVPLHGAEHPGILLEAAAVGRVEGAAPVGVGPHGQPQMEALW